MAELKINCPGCDQHLSVPEELAGQQIDCPSCNTPMIVPKFAEVEEDDEEWVEESTPKSSKLIVGIAAGIAVLGVVAFIALGGDDSQEEGARLRGNSVSQLFLAPLAVGVRFERRTMLVGEGLERLDGERV